MWNCWVGIKNLSTFSSLKKKLKKKKRWRREYFENDSIVSCAWVREDRLIILVLSSVKVPRSSMPQATQITSGKTLHPLWAFLLSFSLVQRGFVRLNRWKILKGSAYSHGSQRQGVLVINFLFSQIAKRPWHCASKWSTSTRVRTESPAFICKSEGAAKEWFSLLYQCET